MPDSPWASGPGEILQHGVSLLKNDSDVNRRLAMITIDNAVELTLKTYLGLPKRVTGLQIGRDKFREISESFPKLLDAVEEHCTDKLGGIDLGIIEWYHRLRNELYHQGNGLTVERNKVEVYAELAKLLYKNLFSVDLPVSESHNMELVGGFIETWARIEKSIQDILRAHSAKLPAGLDGSGFGVYLVRSLRDHKVLGNETASDLEEFRLLRNQIVHGSADKAALTPEVLARAKRAAQEMERVAEESPKP